MERLLQEIESIVDLSNMETEQILSAFKGFIKRRFYVNKDALEHAFESEVSFAFNQQEDEDDTHAKLGKLLLI